MIGANFPGHTGERARGVEIIKDTHEEGGGSMPVAISTASVREALRPRLGSDMVEGCDVADRAAHALRSYAPYRDSLEDVNRRVCDALFDALYRCVGPSMTVRRDNGTFARIHMNELPDVADDVLYALFDSLTVYSVSYGLLKDYSLRTGSLSAMRVLMEKYGGFQSAEETALMARIIREGYPPERWSAWLPHDA